jgi:hypothetical protein
VSLSSFESRALRDIAAKLRERLQDAHNHLGKGAWVVADDAAATGMAAVRRVGEIAALYAALSDCEEVEKELMGTPKKKKEA